MQVQEGLVRDILRLVVWYPFRWLTCVIPVRWTLKLFQWMGDLHWRLGRGARRRMEEALRRVLDPPPVELAGVVRRHFEQHYTDRLHIFLYARKDFRVRVENYVRLANLEVLDAARRRGKGVLLVQPHFGPIQLTLLALAVRGYDPIQIGLPTERGLSRIGRSVAFRQRLRYEAMLPAPILPADEYLGRVYRHLKEGGVVLTTGDGAGGGVFLGEHVEWPLLGTRRMFPLGPARWAVRTDCVFLPTFIVQEAYDRFTVRFCALPDGPDGDPEQQCRWLTEQFVRCLEEQIRLFPWSWHFWDEV